MTKKTISDAVTNISAEYIERAADYSVKKKSHKPSLITLGTMAACLAVAAVVGAVLLRGELFGNRTDEATLDNGNKIIFVKSNLASSSADMDVTVEPLAEDKAAALFSEFTDLPVTANAIYKNSDKDSGNPQELIGFEGTIGNVKIIVSISDVQLLDTVIVGEEETTEINGTSIAAGYFITDPNSKGEQNAIYYATFELGSCKVYLENADTVENRETTKKQLAEVIQKLTENKELDLPSCVDSKAGADLDGNPDGYTHSGNDTSDKEISEQDSDCD